MNAIKALKLYRCDRAFRNSYKRKAAAAREQLIIDATSLPDEHEAFERIGKLVNADVQLVFHPAVIKWIKAHTTIINAHIAAKTR